MLFYNFSLNIKIFSYIEDAPRIFFIFVSLVHSNKGFFRLNPGTYGYLLVKIFFFFVDKTSCEEESRDKNPSNALKNYLNGDLAGNYN